jgi:hypothetical protein
MLLGDHISWIIPACCCCPSAHPSKPVLSEPPPTMLEPGFHKTFCKQPKEKQSQICRSISKKKNCTYIKIAAKECLKNCSNQLYLTNYNLSVKLKGLMQHAPSKQEQEDKEDKED